ncbi:hypothetical protein [Paenibacillus soyae]|uniref:Uncharacterized protein n=1 Tax=Paenibacillus soyae TaxID=2969249 RepID=A0A9X2MS12_9BACL|nr:hypothetical protein [Paenibacillus soyae]MCR2805811.1 hypothetical protein [Paenibacillus soyae]
MFFQEWYDKLDYEKRSLADVFINKVKKMNANADENDALAVAYAELEEDSPALSEYRFVHYLKKSLSEYDSDPENRAISMAKNGYPIIKDTVQKINDAGITGQELMTLLKVFHYEGIMDTFYRFEHTYMDDLNDSEYPSFAISEIGTDGELTGRIVNVYGWLSYLNPDK